MPKDVSFTLSGESNLTAVPVHFFHDLFPHQELNSLIKSGLYKNPHWKAQLAKLEMVKISSGINVSESKPSLTTGLGWVKGEENTRDSNFEKQPIPDFRANALFNWEIDLWGKWKFLQKSSLIHIKEAEYLNESAKISFIHEIAKVWFWLTSKQEQAELLEKAIASQQKSMQFYQHLIDVGIDDNLTYARQSVVYDQLRLQRALILREMEVSKIRLVTLIGQPLETKLSKIPKLSEIEFPSLPKIFPTDALKRRPDIKAKEAKLRESLLLEKASEYDLYPSLAFQMSGITMSSNISKPFEQWKASFGPVFHFPIWSPKKRILLKTARAQSEVKKEEWKAIIFSAIEEIEIATKSFMMCQKEYTLATRSCQKATVILGTTKERLNAGLVSELELLEDERQFLKASLKKAELRMQVFEFALSLSRSLGLRWKEFK